MDDHLLEWAVPAIDATTLSCTGQAVPTQSVVEHGLEDSVTRALAKPLVAQTMLCPAIAALGTNATISIFIAGLHSPSLLLVVHGLAGSVKNKEPCTVHQDKWWQAFSVTHRDADDQAIATTSVCTAIQCPISKIIADLKMT